MTKKTFLTMAGGCALGLLTACAGSGPAEERPYPPAPRGDRVDTYHGIEVADPYRWLEEDSAETAGWIESQGKLLRAFVEPVAQLGELEARLSEIRRYDSVGLPVRRGGRYFYVQTEAGALNGALFSRQGLEGEAHEILNFGEAIREPGHTLGGFSVSPDGEHVAWSALSQAGWGFLEIAGTAGGTTDGTTPGERISGVAGGGVQWTHDSLGFFYVRYGELESLHAGTADPRPQIYYHRLGTDPAGDELIYARDDRPSMLFTPRVSDDGRYLVVGLNDGDRNRNTVIYRPIGGGAGRKETFRTLIEPADAAYVFEGNDGSRFFFRTTLSAPRSRVVAVDPERPEREAWTEVIPERDAPLQSVSHIGGRLVVVSTVHARPVVETWTTDGRREAVLDLPAIGLVGGFADDPAGRLAFYRMNSLIDPGTIYRVDLDTGESHVHHRPDLAFDPEDFEIKQVFYESPGGPNGRDPARIPMFLAHRKDVPLTGDRPLVMYGYGHGGWVAFPWFQPHLLAWLEMGGTYALPGLRGGGEYGREWQEAGTRREKPTTIADFVAAAEWLIERGYTSPERLVANGGSASGVVPAAAAVQRPELFAAALIDFPFLDMLRYHHFTTLKGWTRGYGSADDRQDFEILRAYSPLHNLEEGRCYPATLTVVGEEDITTPPLHGYKFTAALQRAQGCENAALLKLVPGAGHYVYGLSPESAARTEAEILAFLLRSLDLDPVSLL